MQKKLVSFAKSVNIFHLVHHFFVIVRLFKTSSIDPNLPVCWDFVSSFVEHLPGIFIGFKFSKSTPKFNGSSTAFNGSS